MLKKTSKITCKTKFNSLPKIKPDFSQKKTFKNNEDVTNNEMSRQVKMSSTSTTSQTLAHAVPLDLEHEFRTPELRKHKEKQLSRREAKQQHSGMVTARGCQLYPASRLSIFLFP